MDRLYASGLREMHFKGADMYFAAFSPNAIAVGTIGAGAFFAALACLVFLVTRTFVPSQREKELVDAFLLNINHRQDFAMICAYATMTSGLVLWIKGALIKHAK
jgi:hypothetical protein